MGLWYSTRATVTECCSVPYACSRTLGTRLAPLRSSHSVLSIVASVTSARTALAHAAADLRDVHINYDLDDCIPCIKGKLKRSSIGHGPAAPVDRPMATIHSDVCVPFDAESIHHKRFFVSFIDDFRDTHRSTSSPPRTRCSPSTRSSSPPLHIGSVRASYALTTAASTPATTSSRTSAIR